MNDCAIVLATARLHGSRARASHRRRALERKSPLKVGCAVVAFNAGAQTHLWRQSLFARHEALLGRTVGRGRSHGGPSCFSSVWRIALTTVAGLARLVRQQPLLMRGQSIYGWP